MGKEDWKKELEQDLTAFSEADKTEESKRRMFYQIMEEITPAEQTPITYMQAKQLVEDLSVKKKEPSLRVNRRPLWVGAFGAVAAVLAITVLTRTQFQNLSPAAPSTIFSPPLSLSDVPILITEPGTPYRTVATNNNFYLGYSENTAQAGQLNLLVHSRSGGVDWESLSAYDSDNDRIIPLAIDTETNIISLPMAESEVLFEIQDEKGNRIECILPTYL